MFRTSSELPEHVSDTNNFPDFDPNSPIWKVVDSKGKPIPSRNPVVVEGNEASDSFEEESSSRKMTETTQKKGGKVTTPFGSTQAAMEEDEED